MAYSNRPQYGEPQPLGTGDFEAVSYQSSPAYPQIPRAPRTPGFVTQQSAHPSHPSYAGHQLAQTGPFPQHYSARAGSQHPSPSSNRGIPGAPNSLSPMAMATARNAAATGPFATQDAVEMPTRPSGKAGMSILFAGAIIGGLIGAVMHARQNAADAFAAAAQAPTHEVAPLPSGTPGVLPPSSALPGNVIAPPLKDAKLDANAKVDAKDAKADVSKKKKWAWNGAAHPAPAAPIDKGDKSTDDAAEAPATTKKGKKSSSKDDDGYTVASAGGGDDESATTTKKADKPAPAADKPDPKKKDKPAADKSADKAADKSSKPKGGDDAVNVLRAAMGATENTL